MAGKALDPARIWEAVVFCVLFAAVTTWSVSVFPLDLADWRAPSGQGFYLLSKLMGLLTVIAIWWQVMGAILHHPSVSRERLGRHKQSGGLVIVLGVSHYVFFLVAAWLRNGHFPVALLYPVFDNHFKLIVSIGWFALVSLLVAVAFAVFRQFFRKIWRYIHRLVYVAMVLGVFHGFMIGSETGFGAFYYIYLFLMASVVIGLALRFTRWFESRNSMT